MPTTYSIQWQKARYDKEITHQSAYDSNRALYLAHNLNGKVTNIGIAYDSTVKERIEDHIRKNEVGERDVVYVGFPMVRETTKDLLLQIESILIYYCARNRHRDSMTNVKKVDNLDTALCSVQIENSGDYACLPQRIPSFTDTLKAILRTKRD